MLENYKGLHSRSVQLETFIPLYFNQVKENKRIE